MGKKKKILVIMGRYLPGYKDGGPVRTIKNLTDYLGDEYDIHVLTRDRDHGDKQAYSNIKANSWNEVGKAKVYYVPSRGFTFKIIKQFASQVDLIYVCGCYSDYAIKTLVLKRLGLIEKNVIVAAMGLFSPMAFRLKYVKHKCFVTICNVVGMYRNIYWSATSEMEISEIKKQIRAKDDQFFVAEDLPRVVNTTPIKKEKEIGKLRVVWISRISPKKNLLQTIRILAKVKSEVDFTIYGPKHEQEYWTICEKELRRLPNNVHWAWEGNVESEKVVSTLKAHHVFLFTTLGENYGHVIQEALSAGCAVVLSDQTPWKNLETYKAGYVFSIDDENGFVDVIEMYARMNREQMQEIADNALAYAVAVSNEKVKDTGYRYMFDVL